MNFAEAERWVESFTDYELTPGVVYTSSTYDLRRVEKLLARLGSPQLVAKSAHVAGTKGKGSTTAMIASALTAAGYRTGLYTSPHFHTIRERITIDGALITEEEFADATERVRPHVELMNAHLSSDLLTTFEVLTAIAFVHFARRGVQYQALEVGLGGRLDATNVVKPEVCVITSISIDHTQVLGKTVEAIAAEKAGIIKQGIPVVCAAQVRPAEETIAGVCARVGAPLIRVGHDVIWSPLHYDAERQSFRVRGRLDSYELTIPLLGEHQMENAACAVAALEVLAEGGADISRDAMQRGLGGVRWLGRLQVLRRDPLLICDGAHNADSAAKLREALRRHFDFKRAVLVLGTSSDKDITGIVGELAHAFDEVIVTRSCHPRSAAPDMLAGEFARHGKTAKIAENPEEAVRRALEQAGRSDLVCVTGSLFLAGEVIAWATNS